MVNNETGERRIVAIKLGGETRQVSITRSQPGCSWYLETEAIVCRFRQGEKAHKHGMATVIERDGEFFIPAQRIHGHHNLAAPVAWATDSNWNSIW